MKRRRTKNLRSGPPPIDWASATLELIGGTALAGSGFEAERTDIRYPDRVISTPEVEC